MSEKKENSKNNSVEIYDLNESTNIILSLLKKDELPLILAESEKDKDKIDSLIKNFSPSEMAFEVEVLNHENPVVVLFYNPLDNNKEILEVLYELAKKYEDKAKFVKIDSEKLFKITTHSDVDLFPTLIVIHNRNELGRFEKPALESIEQELKKYILP